MSVTAPKALPRADGDFYQIIPTISEEDQALVHRVLGIMGTSYHGYGCPGKTSLLDGVLMMELAAGDSSIATFRGVHSGLAMGSIYLCGSEEQKQQWLPPMARLEKIGAFGLTEPEVGSGTSGGLTTTARR